MPIPCSTRVLIDRISSIQGRRLGRMFLWRRVTFILVPVIWYVWGLHLAFSDTKGQGLPHLLFAQEHHAAKIAVDVNLVLVPVTVTDPAGSIVTGLDRGHFSVYEERQLQQISYFEQVDTPFSVGLVFDVSGSMKDRIETARDALSALFRNANTEDEAFLLTFSAQTSLEVGFTQDLEQIRYRALLARIDGKTAMVDALFEALGEMKRAQNLRRAIVLISDAGGNVSVHTKQHLLRHATEADVRIYPVIVDFQVANREQRLGRAFLEKLANRTGGRCFMVKRSKSMVDAMDQLGRLLHNHYLIGYYPRREAPEGKWQQVRVRLDVNDPRGKLRTDAPSGYYRPSGDTLN